MLDAAMVGTLGLMGLASVPHCALMCGAPCAAAVGTGQARAVLGFQLGRLLGYAAAGAVAAASMAWLRDAAEAGRALRPVWTLLHVALLTLGLYLLVLARWPAWLGRSGFGGGSAAKTAPVRLHRAAGRGLLWFAWPCGVLQGALLVAALANSPLGGALAMAAFALASSPGLLLAPLALKKLMGRTDWAAWAPRMAGAMLVVASGFALGHGLWAKIVDLCT